MIIQRMNKCYEVLRQLSGTSRMAEFLCREQELQETYLLVRIGEPTLAKRFTLFLEEKIVGTEFPDYKECFQSDGAFYAVFAYSMERTLADKQGRENCTKEERTEIVRRLLEQMLLRSPHPYFMRSALRPDMITVADSLDVDWNYHLDEVGTFDYCTMEAVCGQLAEVIKFLFEEELHGKQYPLLHNYLLALEDGGISAYLELYQEFVPVYEELRGEGKGQLQQRFLRRMRNGFKKIVDKPDSYKGYLHLGKRYIAKKLALVLTLPVILLPLTFLGLVYPWVRSRYHIKTMAIDSRDLEGYTGEVRLVGDLEADNVIFVGTLTEGKINGQGTLYDLEGNLRYQGEFAGGEYEGSGTFYYPDGRVCYRGSFSQGLYDGTGTMFYENGVISYEGEFFQGKKSGSGREYDESGELLYDGAFSQDAYEGEGILYGNGQVLSQGSFHLGALLSGETVIYDRQGNLLYQGSIHNGLYDGYGRLFREGSLIYDGLFEQGEYSGEGRLYDGETGGLLYEGGFYRDLYDGEGKLYDSVCGDLIYEGGFREGRYDGQGTIYTEGILTYKGEFLLDVYNGKGILYDLSTGTVIFDGVFHDGQPMEEPVCPEPEDEVPETEAVADTVE